MALCSVYLACVSFGEINLDLACIELGSRPHVHDANSAHTSANQEETAHVLCGRRRRRPKPVSSTASTCFKAPPPPWSSRLCRSPSRPVPGVGRAVTTRANTNIFCQSGTVLRGLRPLQRHSQLVAPSSFACHRARLTKCQCSGGEVDGSLWVPRGFILWDAAGAVIGGKEASCDWAPCFF